LLDKKVFLCYNVLVYWNYNSSFENGEKNNMVRAIVGANWGDEGKGKLTDVFAESFDIVVRFQGGSNAGHTIINNYGEFALHQLPSGVFYPHVMNIIGNGVALSVENFIEEIHALEEHNVPKPNVIISDRAQIVMKYHKLFDEYEEERLSNRKFGSTKSGIAPFYSDKYAKIGFQVRELYEKKEILLKKIEQNIAIKNVILKHLYQKSEISINEVYEKLMEYKSIIAPYVADTFNFLYQAIKNDKNILLEGQLGALKDLDFGIYPMVTSSNTIAGYASVGAGIPPYEIKDIIAVVKAYSSAVGSGEFVSEIFGIKAEDLREKGGNNGEYGTTTNRPRRMGWLDLVATRYGCRVQSATQVAFTALDVLGYLDEIPVCVGYEIDGQKFDTFLPPAQLRDATPVLQLLPGWKCDIKGIRSYDALPINCRNYIEFAERHIGVPINIISNGPSREDIIYR
jgi:adenylosuccinate synthase